MIRRPIFVGVIACTFALPLALGSAGCESDFPPSPPRVPTPLPANSAPTQAHTCKFEVLVGEAPVGTGTLEYDASGRLVDQKIETPSEKTHLVRAYDPNGHLVKEENQLDDGKILRRWERDAKGSWVRVLHEESAKDARGVITYKAMSRDDAGHLVEMRELRSDGPVITYAFTYDGQGRLSELKISTEGKDPIVRTLQYGAHPKPDKIVTTVAGKVELEETIERDAKGRATQVKSEGPSAGVNIRTYEREPSGRIRSMSQSVDAQNKITFRYDKACRPTDEHVELADVVTDSDDPL